ncbi:unnamed protein product [Urochloa humidicola]
MVSCVRRLHLNNVFPKPHRSGEAVSRTRSQTSLHDQRERRVLLISTRQRGCMRMSWRYDYNSIQFN